MEFEDEVFREVGLVTPDDPAYAGVDKAELMAGGIDRFDAGKLEVPAVFYLMSTYYSPDGES